MRWSRACISAHSGRIAKRIIGGVHPSIAYALGAGIPMLLIAYGGQYISTKITGVAKYSHRLQQIFGVIIIMLSLAIYLNYDIKIYAVLLQKFPSINPKF